MLYTFEKSIVAATDSKKNKRVRNSLKRQKKCPPLMPIGQTSNPRINLVDPPKDSVEE